jgi:DNA-binding beta-propeller fold protein YncE
MGRGGVALAVATLDVPVSIALDVAGGKMYVTNNGNHTISQANLDGTGGVSLGNLNGTLDGPFGIALDVPPGLVPVGGIIVPVDKLGLVSPWMGLVALVSLAAFTVAVVRRRRG